MQYLHGFHIDLQVGSGKTKPVCRLLAVYDAISITILMYHVVKTINNDVIFKSKTWIMTNMHATNCVFNTSFHNSQVPSELGSDWSLEEMRGDG